MITMENFYKKYNGKSVDIDGSFGPQCVDVAKLWFKEQGFSDFLRMGYCTDGWAGSLWTAPTKELESSCNRITGYKNFKNGDLVIWGKTTQTPSTHVALYYNGKAFGQNQPYKYCNLTSINMSSAYGAWRIKEKKKLLMENGLFDRKCVMALQKWLGYSPQDGWIGGQSSKYHAYHPNLLSVQYAESGSSEVVRKLQEVLQKDGYKFNKLDGQWGKKTTGYLQQYLTKHGFSVGTDYVFGPKTAKRLQEFLNSKNL